MKKLMLTAACLSFAAQGSISTAQADDNAMAGTISQSQSELVQEGAQTQAKIDDLKKQISELQGKINAAKAWKTAGLVVSAGSVLMIFGGVSGILQNGTGSRESGTYGDYIVVGGVVIIAGLAGTAVGGGMVYINGAQAKKLMADLDSANQQLSDLQSKIN